MLTGRKLALSLAFTALVALATGVSCKGFFVQPTLQSIAVSPTTVNVGVGDQATLSVFGTYSDGSRSTVTSGVSWSVDPIGIVTIVGTRKRDHHWSNVGHHHYNGGGSGPELNLLCNCHRKRYEHQRHAYERKRSNRRRSSNL